MPIMTQMEGAVIANAVVNVRKQPSVSVPILRRLEPGAEYRIKGVAVGDAVAGQDLWYAGEDDTFVWSGAMRRLENDAGVAFTSVDGYRREDGTLKPLPMGDIVRLFGDLGARELAGGRVQPSAAWARNIVRIRIPSVLGGLNMEVHRLAAPYFKSAFAAVVAAGLADRILTFGGTYVPRHVGWNAARRLSSHSWGIAIDLNVAWNGYGSEPAPIGAIGSLREIVPYMEGNGFAWGGRFAPSSARDGMHFELARRSVI